MSVLATPTIEGALHVLDERLDLALIRLKLADRDEGKGWNEHQLDIVETAYRQFLALKMVYPDDDVVPTKAIDEMWHYHILDTAKYDADCDVLFGCRLDHYHTSA